MRIPHVVCALGALVLAPLSSAQAQHLQIRQGFWFHGGIGYGSFGCRSCEQLVGRPRGFGGTAALGGTINQHILVGVGLNGWAESSGTVRHLAGTLTAQLRVYPSATGGFFVVGGVGFGKVRITAPELNDTVDSGPGAMLGLGYDLRVGGNTSLTPFVSGFGISLKDGHANMGQIGIGLTFH